VHFTPTYASWLNQVQRWFGHCLAVDPSGSFAIVKQLVQCIEAFVQHYNLHPRPFA